MQIGWSRQSPQNLEVITGGKVQKKKLEFNDNYAANKFYILNDGHTVQVQLAATSEPEVTIGGLTGTYKFAQLHFHWGDDTKHGSEHKINSVRYSMEAHFVHYNSKYADIKGAVASKEKNALAVVGVFLDAVDLLQLELLPDLKANEALTKIADAVPVFKEEATLVNKKLDLVPFLPAKGDKVLQYDGSLTTPDCNEVVYWTVKQTPIKVTTANIKKFTAMKGKNGKTFGLNYRRVGQRKLQLSPITVE